MVSPPLPMTMPILAGSTGILARSALPGGRFRGGASSAAGESWSDEHSDTGFGAGTALKGSGSGTGATGSAYLNSRNRVATGTPSSAYPLSS